MEHLCVHREGYFHVLVFCVSFFNKRSRKHSFSALPCYGNTRGSLRELEIVWKHSWKLARTRNSVETLLKFPYFLNAVQRTLYTQKKVGVLPIWIVKSNVSSVGHDVTYFSISTVHQPFSISSPYRQYTNLFLFRFVSEHCLR